MEFLPPIVASFVSIAINKLWDGVSNGISDSAEVRRQLELLKAKLKEAQRTLDRVGPRQMNRRSWEPVRGLTNLCYQIEDVIARKLAKNGRGSFRDTVNQYLNLLETLEQEVKKLVVDSPESSGQTNNDVVREWMAAVVPPLLAGRQNDKNNIVEKLLTGDAVGVSIVGMPGLGKTALARSILEDARIMEHFPIILGGSAAGGLDDFKNGLSDTKAGHVEQSKNCLLVVDDLQDFRPRYKACWEDIIRSIETNKRKCTVLVTTRDQRVAWFTETTPYYLKLLSDEDCGTLVRDIVSPALRNNPNDSVCFERSAINCIVKLCKGLPLVAHVVAHYFHALLCRPSFSVKDAIIYLMSSDFRDVVGEDLFERMRLKIPKLKSQSKLLAYFSLFPQGHILDKGVLFQHWMAEGFIEPEKEWKDWETTADQYFEEILSASMIEIEDPNSYQVVPITHMFAESIPSNMCFCVGNEGGRRSSSFVPPSDTRHIAVCCQSIEEEKILRILNDIADLRTFLFLPKDGSPIINTRVLRHLFQKLSVMRVLDLSGSCLVTVPPSIGNLKHLYYLDLSHTDIRILPKSFCDLLALTILNLSDCSKLKKLPDKFSNLVKLVHLYSTSTKFYSIPPNLGKLTKLQTFQQFIVGESRGCRITELGNMEKLSSSIEIVQLENVKNKAEAKKANLSSKTRLTSLKLQWTESSMQQMSLNAKEVLDGLQLPENLVELQVTNYNSFQRPCWFDSFRQIQYQHLKKIHLDNWPHCRNLPPFWILPVLRLLWLDSIHGLRRVDSEFLRGGGHLGTPTFPCLEWFELRNMNNLVAWDELVDGDMPRLKFLKIINCKQLNQMPSLHLLTSLRELEISKCDNLLQNPDIPLGCDFYFAP